MGTVFRTNGQTAKAIKYTGSYRELPLKLQDYLAQSDLVVQKTALQVLSRMTKHSDLQAATGAFIDTLERGLSDPDSIWSNFVRLTSCVMIKSAVVNGRSSHSTYFCRKFESTKAINHSFVPYSIRFFKFLFTKNDLYLISHRWAEDSFILSFVNGFRYGMLLS